MLRLKLISTANRKTTSKRRIAIWTRFFGGATERIPFWQSLPNSFTRYLGVVAQAPKIDAGNETVLHTNFAVYDDRVDVITNATFNDALHRIADRAVAQRIPAC